MVFDPVGLENVTTPGPLALDQVVWSVPFGRPSTSLAVPERLTPAGNTTDVRSALALTTGGAFAVMVTSELEDSSPSVTVSRNTYVPHSGKLGLVLNALADENVALSGPLTCVQVGVSVPFGKTVVGRTSRERAARRRKYLSWAGVGDRCQI